MPCKARSAEMMQTSVESTSKPGNYRSLLGKVVCLGTIFTLGCYLSLYARDHSASRPVILLTGFEPFGKDRPANPSWEGIKELDGQTWNGYRLVCKQLPVIW